MVGSLSLLQETETSYMIHHSQIKLNVPISAQPVRSEETDNFNITDNSNHPMWLPPPFSELCFFFLTPYPSFFSVAVSDSEF
ncbi:hypothetical protein RJT34_13453 [Clitoria ternatea]|uniref:Uncharacterized protein n=1 Tax=Clitoria ternatea TaxID=43366 RepID=A0AAN9JQN4_CLITE